MMEQQTKILPNQKEMSDLKCLVFASIISADNDIYDEDVKQDVLRRYGENKEDPDWWYILEPLGEDRDKFAKLMEAV